MFNIKTSLRRLVGVGTTLALLAVLSTPAQAGQRSHHGGKRGKPSAHKPYKNKSNKNRTNRGKGQCDDGSGRGDKKALGAPEIDPNLVSGGLVLLLGGTVILMSRKRPVEA